MTLFNTEAISSEEEEEQKSTLHPLESIFNCWECLQATKQQKKKQKKFQANKLLDNNSVKNDVAIIKPQN